ncbi:hypothetical protein E2C01_097448 [Portunus trituberculatus]|uniref:Uncharacterized protein n=1 Tax=Portunus trituberculatus TaxID=210409 RepID=A0A5B7K4H3_PORTR|nr:hypothetical protein [Portunus trituberculatus]
MTLFPQCNKVSCLSYLFFISQDMIGFNLAGLRHLKDRVEQRSETQLFVEASQRVKESRRKKKKKDRAVKRVLMAL